MRSTSNNSKFVKIITTPIRFLKKGRDMYVKSMMDYAQKTRYGGSSSTMMVGSIGKDQTVSGLPKSFSTSVTSSRSSNYESEDLRELIRANSTTNANNNMGLDVELYLKQLIKEQQLKQLKESMDQNNFGKSKSTKGFVPRSCSVGMGRIDEDKACEFDEEEEEEEIEELSGKINGVKKKEGLYSRSRSHAVGETASSIGVF